MEPNRYWLLYIGILLIFISSQIGQTICWRVFNLVRACFYMTLALIAAGAAKLLWAVTSSYNRAFFFFQRVQNRETSWLSNG